MKLTRDNAIIESINQRSRNTDVIVLFIEVSRRRKANICGLIYYFCNLIHLELTQKAGIFKRLV